MKLMKIFQKKHLSHILKTTISFSLLLVVAGFLAIFLKPTVTGAVVLNNNLNQSSRETIVIFLFIALVFFVVYAAHLNLTKK